MFGRTLEKPVNHSPIANARFVIYKLISYFSTSEVVYHTGKLIERVVHCLDGNDRRISALIFFGLFY